MKNKKSIESGKKAVLLTGIGVAAMILLTATKAVPGLNAAGLSVFVGIAFFFIVEAVGRQKGPDSGLRFNTVMADLKKPGVIVWALLPVFSGIAAAALGALIFGDEYGSHVVGRAGDILALDKAPLLVIELVVAAFGEEIAYRGFFLGKGMKAAPFWACAVLSSAVFALGHISEGSAGVVMFDVLSVFVDSLIFSMVYRKSGNCVISTISHIIANAFALVVLTVGL